MFFYLNPINIKGEVYSLVDEIENSAYKNYGRFDTKFNGIISREDFSEMNYRDNVLVQYYFDQLKKVAKKEYCIFIKFDPAIHVNDYDSKSYNTNRY